MSQIPPPPPPSSAQERSARDILSEPQRQSPIAVVFLILKMIRNIGLINLGIAAAFVFGRGLAAWMLVAATLVLLGLTTAGVLGWWRFTFQIAGDELVVHKGVLQQERLTVPLDRVQSVAIEQGVLHRSVGLVKASIETAGSSDAELELDAVTRESAVALQRLAAERLDTSTVSRGQAATPGPATQPEEERTLVRLSPGRLMLVAIAQSPWAGLALFAPLIAVGDDLAGVLNIDLGIGDRFDDLEVGATLIGFIALLILLATLLSIVLQVIREVLTHWQLTLTRTASGLRRDAGLINKTTLSTSLPRVQRFETSQTVVQKLFGIHTMHMPTIGSGDIAIPGATDADIPLLRDVVIDPAARVADLDRRVSPLAVFLAVRNTTIIVLVAIAATFFFAGWWVLLALVAIPWVGLVTRRSNRLFRWGLAPIGIAKREMFVAVDTAAMSMHKVQTVAVTQSFFERRRELASITLRTAEGSFRLGMLDAFEARALRDRVLFVVEQNDTVWM